MRAAHTANEIAAYLLWRVANEQPDDPDYLTPMKLQKLLYYVQGWHLFETRQPAFREEIRAWRDGPVVKEVYQAFRHLGKSPITEHQDEPPALAPMTKALVDGVWNRYKGYSAFGLSGMTHAEMPWKKARGTRQQNEPSDVLMPLVDLQREFSDQADRAYNRLRAHAKQVRAAAREHTRRIAPAIYADLGDLP